ncbi:MAG: hypothetical protein ACTHM7_20440 [Ginsengibacter sp.]
MAFLCGEDWYQEEGKAAQFLKAGDILITHDGVKDRRFGTHCHHYTKTGLVGVC